MQEEAAMKVLWRLGEGTVKDILVRYDEPQPPYTTLASVVKNLERKQYVEAKRVGNTYLYRPLVDEAEYKRATSRRMVKDYFGNSYRSLVSFFVQEEKITADELRSLLREIEEGDKQQ